MRRLLKFGSALLATILTCGLAGQERASAVPNQENRGYVDVVADVTLLDPGSSTYDPNLAPKLQRLAQDLAGEGWTVVQHSYQFSTDNSPETLPYLPFQRNSEVNAAGVPGDLGRGVRNLKQALRQDAIATNYALKNIILVGHLPQPYTGDRNFYWYGTQLGAWPCDGYYADISPSNTNDAAWTDTTVNDTTEGDPRYFNIPGDGKFDNSTLPYSAQIAVGRIDFANMGAFASLTESQLLERYLDKDHSYRIGATTALPESRVYSPFSFTSTNTNLDTMYGPSAVYQANLLAPVQKTPSTGIGYFGTGDLFYQDMSQSSYQWVAVDGYANASNTVIPGDLSNPPQAVVNTTKFASNDPHALFYFIGNLGDPNWSVAPLIGDWQSTNALVRAAIATPSYGLAAVWQDTPTWNFTSLANGDTLGSAVLAIDQAGNSTQAGLMGDPTLPLQVGMAPTGVTVAPDSNTAGAVDLTWATPLTNDPSILLQGYNVYSSNSQYGPYTKLNASLVLPPSNPNTNSATTTYVDSAPSQTKPTYYEVRAVYTQYQYAQVYLNPSSPNATGSFTNLSPAAYGTYDPSLPQPPAVAIIAPQNFEQPNGSSYNTTNGAPMFAPASLTVSANAVAYGTSTIDHVDFDKNGITFATVKANAGLNNGSGPWSASVSGLPAGAYVFTAVATAITPGGKTLTTTSAPVRVYVYNQNYTWAFDDHNTNLSSGWWDNANDNSGIVTKAATPGMPGSTNGWTVSIPYSNTIDYTDLAVSATNNTQVSSAGNKFTTAEIGLQLVITGGAGFNPGTYTIVSVDSNNVATLNGVAGNLGATNGTGHLNVPYTSYIVQHAPIDTSKYGQTFFSAIIYNPNSVDLSGVSVTIIMNGPAPITRTFSVPTISPGSFTWVSEPIAGLPGAVRSLSSLAPVQTNIEGFKIDGPTTPLIYHYTDLVIQTDTTQVASAARPFQPNDVGETLNITGGAGFTVKSYTIIGVNSGIATLSAAAGTAGSMNGVADLNSSLTSTKLELEDTGFETYQFNNFGDATPSASLVNYYTDTPIPTDQLYWAQGYGYLLRTDAADTTSAIDEADFYAGTATPPPFYNYGTVIQPPGGQQPFSVQSYLVNWVPQHPGQNYLSAKVFDGQGNTASTSTVRVQVADLYGYVTDQNGTPLSGATITVKNGTTTLATIKPGSPTGAATFAGADASVTANYSDLTVSNSDTHVVTSATRPFSQTDKGGILEVKGGAGFNAGLYLITGVTSIGTTGTYSATLDTSVGIAGSTGGIAKFVSNPSYYSDLAVSAANLNQVTSAAHPFTLSDVNSTIDITGGTGFSKGTYTITSVSSAGVATLNANVATGAATGGIAVVGHFGESNYYGEITPGTGYTITASAANYGTLTQSIDLSMQKSLRWDAALLPTTSAVPTLSASGAAERVNLSWTSVQGATSYNIYRGSSSGAEAATPIKSVTGTSYADTGLLDGTTYYYTVAAVNSQGTGPMSNEAFATTRPPVPTGLAAVGGNKQVSLTWTASLAATSYNIYMGTAPKSLPLLASGVTGTAYTAVNLKPDTTYYFAVAAVDAAGASGLSGQTPASALTAPAAPTNVTAVGLIQGVQLTWDPTPGATSYNIFQATTSGGETSTPVVSGITTTNYAIAGLNDGTTYYFKVVAVNSSGPGDLSAEAHVTTRPAAPGSLVAVPGTRKIALSWGSSPTATSYNIYRSATSGQEGTSQPIATVTGTNYTDTGLLDSTTYYYEVAAVNGQGVGALSAEAQATTFPPPPGAATNLSAVAGDKLVRLTWTAATGATSYKIYVATTAGGEKDPPAGSVSGTTFTVTGLTDGTLYYFTVVAINLGGPAPSSAEIPARPEAPVTFSAGLHFFSVPFDYSNMTIDQALQSSTPVTVAAWNPTAFAYAISPTAPADHLRLGVGYWSKFPSYLTTADGGTPADPTKNFTINLKAGWNAIGDPFTTSVVVSSLTFAGGAETFAQATAGTSPLIASTVWQYDQAANSGNGGYTAASSLGVGSGYWIYAYRDTAMVVPHP